MFFFQLALCMIAILSHSISASSKWWVVRRTARPDLRRSIRSQMYLKCNKAFQKFTKCRICNIFAALLSAKNGRKNFYVVG